MVNIEQAQQMIPLITCAISLGQYGMRVVLGVDVVDLDFGIQVDSIEQPIKNSVSPGNMSHCGTSAFNNHFNYSLIVLEHIQ